MPCKEKFLNDHLEQEDEIQYGNAFFSTINYKGTRLNVCSDYIVSL